MPKLPSSLLSTLFDFAVAMGIGGVLIAAMATVLHTAGKVEPRLRRDCGKRIAVVTVDAR